MSSNGGNGYTRWRTVSTSTPAAPEKGGGPVKEPAQETAIVQSTAIAVATTPEPVNADVEEKLAIASLIPPPVEESEEPEDHAGDDAVESFIRKLKGTRPNFLRTATYYAGAKVNGAGRGLSGEVRWGCPNRARDTWQTGRLVACFVRALPVGHAFRASGTPVRASLAPDDQRVVLICVRAVDPRESVSPVPSLPLQNVYGTLAGLPVLKALAPTVENVAESLINMTPLKPSPEEVN